jgi:hypothetical protein
MGPAEWGRVLASDREREATILRLRAAHLEGRIETDEFEDRVGRAENARTRAELEAIGADLPERSAAAVEPTSGVPWFPAADISRRGKCSTRSARPPWRSSCRHWNERLPAAAGGPQLPRLGALVTGRADQCALSRPR